MRNVNFDRTVFISVLRTSDLRTLQFCARYLNRLTFTHSSNHFPPAPRKPLPEMGRASEIREAFKEYLDDHAAGKDFLIRLDKLLIDLVQLNVVEADRLKWLSKNKEACIFFYISMLPEISSSALSKGLESFRWESQYFPCKSHEARYKHIIEKLDGMETSAVPGKCEYFNRLEDRYQNAKKLVKPLPWLSADNSEAIEWAWNYLIKYHEREVSAAKEIGTLDFALSGNPIGIPTLVWLAPDDSEEKYLSFYAALRNWNCHPAELKLFRSNISKAWRQHQVRKSMKTRPINTHIRADAKEQLDALSRHYKWSLAKTLEVLIDHAYRDIKGKI